MYHTQVGSKPPSSPPRWVPEPAQRLWQRRDVGDKLRPDERTRGYSIHV